MGMQNSCAIRAYDDRHGWGVLSNSRNAHDNLLLHMRQKVVMGILCNVTVLACRAGQRFSPEGSIENSPAFQRWDSNPKSSQVPKGRKNRATIRCFCRPIIWVLGPQA